MTKLKGIFVNDNFGNILYDLFFKNYEYIADDYLYGYVLDIKEMSISDIKEVFEIGDCLVFILDCSRDLFHFYYEFKFHRDVHKVYLNCYSKLPYENDDDLVLLNGYCVSFDDKLIDSLFNLPQIEEKTTSEPEQPTGDAEAKDNPEQTPAEDAEAEDNPELTPLERAIFEAFENSSNLYVEYICKSLDVMKDEEIDEYGCYSSVVLEQVEYFHELASIEDLKTQFLLEIISKAGLDETYQAWLAERKKQEVVGVSK
ncbi:MAG: hypothetical protein U0L18_02895 [Acutalibacteraceae bacterium]|nr:hypothetical protein [Acutalibacteraceae bacterium]